MAPDMQGSWTRNCTATRQKHATTIIGPSYGGFVLCIAGGWTLKKGFLILKETPYNLLGTLSADRTTSCKQVPAVCAVCFPAFQPGESLQQTKMDGPTTVHL